MAINKYQLFSIITFLTLAPILIGCQEVFNNKDTTTIYKEMKKKADKGDLGAQYNLGMMYEYGHGVNKDFSKAFEWYKKAAEQGMLMPNTI